MPSEPRQLSQVTTQNASKWKAEFVGKNVSKFRCPNGAVVRPMISHISGPVAHVFGFSLTIPPVSLTFSRWHWRLHCDANGSGTVHAASRGTLRRDHGPHRRGPVGNHWACAQQAGLPIPTHDHAGHRGHLRLPRPADAGAEDLSDLQRILHLHTRVSLPNEI